MPASICNMHEAILEKISTLQRERSEDRVKIEVLDDCIQALAIDLAQMKTRMAMWAGGGATVGGIIGAIAAALIIRTMA